MSKGNVPPILLSFLLGASCASLVLSGVQALTWAQSSASTSPTTPAPFRVPAQARAMSWAVPSAPGLGPEIDGLVVEGKRAHQLDGLACNNCRFNTPTLTYGGGAYKLKNVTFGPGPIRVVLNGAALNTFNLFRLMGYLKRPTPGGPPAGFVKPRAETVELKVPLDVTTDSMARLVK